MGQDGDDAARPHDPEQRIVPIDVVRGMALFGVMAMNLVTDGFRVPLFAQFLPQPGPVLPTDKVASAFLAIALEQKAFCLFSFLFGVSMAMLFERLTRTGRPFYWLSRRLAALLAFGVVHLVFIWNGDILTEYAIAGFIVLAFLAAPTQALAVVAAGMLLLFVTLAFPPLPSLWLTENAFREYLDGANVVYATGGYWEIRRFSLSEWPLLLTLHVHVLPRTIALFLLGVLAWRVGLFGGTADARRLLRWIAIVACGIGGALSVVDHAGVPLVLNALGPFRYALPRLAPAILALGYAAAIVAFVQSRANRTVLAAFAPIGQMAFTNYILQSVIFGLIFFGYGLGYFGQLRVAPTLLLGIVVFALQCGLSAWWLRRYRFGPLEWLWRTVMYGRVQPLSR